VRGFRAAATRPLVSDSPSGVTFFPAAARLHAPDPGEKGERIGLPARLDHTTVPAFLSTCDVEQGVALSPL
jgi:hypothetical protein